MKFKGKKLSFQTLVSEGRAMPVHKTPQPLKKKVLWPFLLTKLSYITENNLTRD